MAPPSLILVLLALSVPLSLSSSSSSSSEVLEVSVELEDFVRYQPEQVHLSINGESNLSSRNCKSSGFWLHVTFPTYTAFRLVHIKRFIISFAENGDSVTVTWSTVDRTPKSKVRSKKTFLMCGHF